MQIGNGTAGSIGYQQGDAVTLDVAITTNATQVSSLDPVIDYDPTRLSISNLSSAPYDFGGDVTNLTNWIGTCNTGTPGQVSVSLDSYGPPFFSSNSVNVLALTFHVLPGATAGATSVTFDPSSDCLDTTTEPMTIVPVKSTIDVLPAGTVDTILIRRDASVSSEADVFFNNSGSTPTATPAISDLSQPQWNLLGGAGDDQLTVDLSNGDPLPQSSAGGLTYNGGGYVAGNQLLLADSSPASHGTWSLSTGQASLADGGALNYSNVQTLCLAGSAARMNGADAIPAGTALTLSNAATLDLGGQTEVVGPVTLQSGQISNGTLSGTSGLTKNTTGTATLSSNDTYTGGTTVNQGSLVAENSAAIPTGSTLAVAAGGSIVLGTPGAAEPLGLGSPPAGAGGGVLAPSAAAGDGSTADAVVSGSSAVAQNAAAAAASAATASVDAAAATAAPAQPIQTVSQAAPGPSLVALFPAAWSQDDAVDRWSAAPAPQSIAASVAPPYQGPSLGCKPQPSAASVAWQQATDEVLARAVQATSSEATAQSHDHGPPAALPGLDYSTLDILAEATAKR
jgi:autotransporter-associated beta strand protein